MDFENYKIPYIIGKQHCLIFFTGIVMTNDKGLESIHCINFYIV